MNTNLFKYGCNYKDIIIGAIIGIIIGGIFDLIIIFIL